MTAALLSILVSSVFAAVMARRWYLRRRSHQAAWAIGLAMFALANVAGALARVDGATAEEYRLFYLFGAITNVAWLALGSLHLLAPAGVARPASWIVMLLTVVGAAAVFASPVDLTKAVDTGRGFETSPLPRILAGIGSGAGSVILIGGALWSAWVFLRRRHQGRRALANVLIAAGVFVAAAGGTAAFTGASGIVEWSNLAGITLIFIGFLLA